MNMLQVMIVAMAIIVGLTGCASSHTRHHHETHTTSHGKASKHGAKHYKTSHHYVAPHYTPPAPYTLPGGLQSVCTGGTPPPCN